MFPSSICYVGIAFIFGTSSLIVLCTCLHTWPDLWISNSWIIIVRAWSTVLVYRHMHLCTSLGWMMQTLFYSDVYHHITKWLIMWSFVFIYPAFVYYLLSTGSCKCRLHEKANMLCSCANQAHQGRTWPGRRREIKGRVHPGCIWCIWADFHHFLNRKTTSVNVVSVLNFLWFHICWLCTFEVLKWK